MTTTTQASGECQYIGTEQAGPVYKPVCCSATVAGRSYCEQHLWLVYKQGSNLRTRHKDIRTADNARLWESLFNEAIEELEEEGFL